MLYEEVKNVLAYSETSTSAFLLLLVSCELLYGGRRLHHGAALPGQTARIRAREAPTKTSPTDQLLRAPTFSPAYAHKVLKGGSA